VLLSSASLECSRGHDYCANEHSSDVVCLIHNDTSEQPLKDGYDEFSTWPKVSSNGGSSLGAFIKFSRRRDENIENRFSFLSARRRSSETFTARIQTFKETRQLSKGSYHYRASNGWDPFLFEPCLVEEKAHSCFGASG
jgi:hypothetical protein